MLHNSLKVSPFFLIVDQILNCSFENISKTPERDMEDEHFSSLARWIIKLFEEIQAERDDLVQASEELRDHSAAAFFISLKVCVKTFACLLKMAENDL